MKPFTRIAVIVFSLVALMHLLRLLFSSEVTVNSSVIPMWVSVLGFLVAGALAVMLWREARK